MRDDDFELRDLLRTLSPSAREHLRDVLIRDQADRDAISSQLMRYRDERGDDWADIIECPDPQLVGQETRFCAEAGAGLCSLIPQKLGQTPWCTDGSTSRLLVWAAAIVRIPTPSP